MLANIIRINRFCSKTLTITVGDNAHTTGWTDASKDIPDVIINIVNGIKRIVSNEKIV
jgi:hypothetical protein